MAFRMFIAFAVGEPLISIAFEENRKRTATKAGILRIVVCPLKIAVSKGSLESTNIEIENVKLLKLIT